MADADVIVIGSGPSGAHAAKQAHDAGIRVVMLDYGNDAPEARNAIPEGTFAELRRRDRGQRAYFLGTGFSEELERNDRLGAHFTAPRAFVSADSARLLPVASATFSPVQSLALGGLGAGWGAGAPTFERFELEAVGLAPETISRYYDDVVEDIGVSAAREDDTAESVVASALVQPPSDVDSNACSLLDAYRVRRDTLRDRGFALGRAPLALLTRPIMRGGLERFANPYNDMDFYGDARRSVYRPRYTVEELRSSDRFRYIGGVLVQRFEENEHGVRVVFVDRNGDRGSITGRTLLLAAGALNTARIVLRSRNLSGVKLPLLCNTMSFVACVNRRMFGRPARDRRHSLAQLMAVYTPPHRGGDRVVGAFYSYRSLLNYRLVKDMPLPVPLGLLATRLLLTSLTIVGVHHPERPSADKWISLRPGTDILDAQYEVSADERSAIAHDLAGFEGCLRDLGCVKLGQFPTPAGSSIHYAGTIPSRNDRAPLQSEGSGRLRGCERVFLADSSTWNALPAKGLTLTLMANARRVASEAVAALRAGSIT
ncbi:MAG TPA: hypothetical protein VMF11_00980 [Candidatus Baltobacteraceae bacterium]|nr:hypothetical protein [Candidatus Baltobacteraceae bacterium]